MPHFAMKQSGLLAAIFRLPDEILEEIVSELDQHRDLVTFALTSRICADLVIPHHTEYRILRTRHSLPYMWAHLARRADLARNVREVHICARHIHLASDHYPTTLIDKNIDEEHGNANESVRIRNICQALGHMDRLRVFDWSWEEVPGQQRPTSHPAHENAILSMVSQLPKLDSLRLAGKFALHALDSFRDQDSVNYPAWKVTDLTSLSLAGDTWARPANSKHLCRLISRSPNLEYLEVPLEFQHLAECHLPNLKRLKLAMQAGGTVGLDQSRVLFLLKHPGIEELHWLPTNYLNLTVDCLPNLKRLTTSRHFMSALNDPEAAKENLNPLTPPSTPVTAAHTSTSPEDPNPEPPRITRAIESLDVHSLDPQMLLDLKCIERASLRQLNIHAFSDISALYEVAEQFPNIEWLRLPIFHLPTGSPHAVRMTKECYLDLLPRFPNLKIFRGQGIWEATNDDMQAMHEAIATLIETCPNLVELDHKYYNDKYGAYNLIVIKTVGEHVTYEIRKPHPRNPFDVMNGLFG